MSDHRAEVLGFPQTRVRVKSTGPLKNLGLGKLSREMSREAACAGRGARGHWCSRCQGVWYSYLPEVECPQCGNRQG